jgi:t-SNARE complex subunit (syntaxin)
MKMKDVKFLRGTLVPPIRYNKGEVAAFDEETAKSLIKNKNAVLVREYEKEVNPLSEMGSGDFFNKEKEIEAKQDRQDKANEATIKARWQKYAVIVTILAVIVAVVTLMFLVYFKVF